MTTTTARKARTMTAPTTEPIPSGTLIQQAREHASNGLLSRLAEARKALTERSRVVGIVGDDGAIYAELGQVLADTLEAGGQVPDDYQASMTAAITERQVRTDEARVVRHAHQLLTDRVSDVTRNASDGGLHWLDDRLQSVLVDTRACAVNLAGIGTADEAINAGPDAMNAWRQIRSHVQQYREVRRAQQVLTADALGGYANVPNDVRWAGITRVPFDEIYSEAVGLIQSWTRAGFNERRVFEPEPWPGATLGDEGRHDDIVPSSDPVAFVIWLADRGDAWCPGVKELADALEARRLAITLKTPMAELSGAKDIRVENLRHLDRLQPAGATR